MNVRRTAIVVGLSAVPLALSGGTAFAADAPTAPTAAAVAASGCPSGALPSTILGNPGVKAQAPEGFYLWHGKAGYELRVTHPGKSKVVMSGTITVSKVIGKVHRLRFEAQDTAKVAPGRKTLAFRLVDHGGVDGIGFTADCSATVVVHLSIDGQPATTSQVFLGAGKTSPTSVPFRIERTAVTPA
jgi:hypothetical protein